MLYRKRTNTHPLHPPPRVMTQKYEKIGQNFLSTPPPPLCCEIEYLCTFLMLWAESKIGQIFLPHPPPFQAFATTYKPDVLHSHFFSNGENGKKVIISGLFHTKNKISSIIFSNIYSVFCSESFGSYRKKIGHCLRELMRFFELGENLVCKRCFFLLFHEKCNIFKITSRRLVQFSILNLLKAKRKKTDIV